MCVFIFVSSLSLSFLAPFFLSLTRQHRLFGANRRIVVVVVVAHKVVVVEILLRLVVVGLLLLGNVGDCGGRRGCVVLVVLVGLVGRRCRSRQVVRMVLVRVVTWLRAMLLLLLLLLLLLEQLLLLPGRVLLLVLAWAQVVA